MATYFDISKKQFTDPSWMHLSDEALRKKGILPYVQSPVLPYDTYIEKLWWGDTTWDEYNAWQSVEIKPLSIPELQMKLEQIQREKKAEFSSAFLHLEERAARPTSTLTLRIGGGETTFPDDDFDMGLLWSIEQVKQTNRDLLTALSNTTIDAQMALEAAQSVVQEARLVLPWIPSTYAVG